MDSTRLFSDRKRLNQFVQFLINDVKALEKMLAADMFEKEIVRVGVEQELCLVDKQWRPAPLNLDILARLPDSHFTTEHSRFNLEINLDPVCFKGDCLSALQAILHDKISLAREAAAGFDADVILAGILPTIRRSDLELENLTPLPRYHLMNEAMTKLRGRPYEFRINGTDELITTHSSIMFEGCNTSFQVHIQVEPDEFVEKYNWAQAIAAPILAAATNSPLLLGKRLWQETRIALFQQSVDTRRPTYDLTEKTSRITFGTNWLRNSITELFQEDIARYRVLIGRDIDEDSLAVINQGELPTLEALRIHNSTIYRWNRGCYGITDDRPHLRIENRILPSGPTIVDEIANMAFWLGLMAAVPQQYKSISDLIEFDEVRLNFLSAARSGLAAQFKWVGNELIPAGTLILETLLPLAKQGLVTAGIDQSDIDHYLGIIEARVSGNKPGSRWMLDSYAALNRNNAKYESCVALTAGVVHRQRKDEPVHTWTPATIEEAGPWVNRYWKVEQIMSTDFVTVQQKDPLSLVSNIMTWKRLRYVPVEDDQGNFAGLVTANKLLDYYNSQKESEAKSEVVSTIMIRKPLIVSPESLSIEALTTMREAKVGCLPVIKDNKLIGLLTDMNFMHLSEHSIQELRQESQRYLDAEKRPQ